MHLNLTISSPICTNLNLKSNWCLILSNPFNSEAAMATNTPKPAKQLGELLQVQQEPFVLEVYLQERGYLKKSLKSGGSFVCCQPSSGKHFERSASSGPKRSRKSVLHCSKILRAVFNKLVSANNQNQRKRHASKEDGNFSAADQSQVVVESDRFSSASSTTVFNSCFESDTEDAYSSLQNDHNSGAADTLKALQLGTHREIEIQAATDRKRIWRFAEDSKQLSPVSVLEEIPSSESSPAHKNLDEIALGDGRTGQEVNQSTSDVIFSKKVLSEDSIFSASLRELFLCTPIKKPSCGGVAELQELAWFDPSSQPTKSRMVLLQTRQLLLDCVREVVEYHKGKGRQRQGARDFQGPEEIGKLICAKIRAWGKQSGDETNITQLLHLNFSASAEEWNDFKPQAREIGMHIADVILEEIKHEVVVDLMYFSTSKSMSR
ncbi:uncharacterized protein LOC131162486 isoform X2 [Malania oleifera]|uniref:uncharacterized protein LOC131162486 isoform X2 n=1 Tax=Malania oleifera TaxID=397392 RepID=UPI0025ADAC82|nr:uncharacterized protein LOC131162486 isoform X2 [Malania oleifera]